MPAAATAATAVTGIAIAGYLVVFRPGAVPDSGAAIAAAAVSGSRAVAVLEEQRQQMIVVSAAAHSTHLVHAPKVAAQPQAGTAGGAAGGGTVSTVNLPAPDPGTAQRIAYDMLASFGFTPASTYFSCLNNIWTRESNWRYNAENASGAYGIPQALPASKMASAGSDYLTNPATQIRWGLGYIKSVYHDPCSAWSFWQAHGYY
jgi:Transglycosylase SLT domain